MSMTLEDKFRAAMRPLEDKIREVLKDEDKTNQVLRVLAKHSFAGDDCPFCGWDDRSGCAPDCFTRVYAEDAKAEAMRLMGVDMTAEERIAKAKEILVGAIAEIEKLGVNAYHSPGSHDGNQLKTHCLAFHSKSRWEITGVP
jgi:hypothetical protein